MCFSINSIFKGILPIFWLIVTFNMNAAAQCSDVSYANIYMSEDSVCPNTEINFNANGDGSNFSWDFGDGSTSDEQYPNHAYSSTGTYQVSLTVTNDCGNDTTVYDSVYVLNDLSINENADIYISEDTICPNTRINFNPYASSGGDFVWTFGDGSSLNGAYVAYRYDSTGDYPISLKITNALRYSICKK
ncbi:MAG: PKD domain-containing protein [Flavobacteriales bacterium]